MKLLRDDGLVAVNDLISLCLEAAALDRDAAASAQDPLLAQSLAALAERCQIAADRLIADLRRHHELPPTQPQDEKLLLQKVLAHAKAALAPAGDAQLLADCRAREQAIAAAAAAALGFELSDQARATIAALRDSSAHQAPGTIR